VFQLLVKVGSFVAWPGFCTYEKTAIAAEYSKLLGLEEVEAFLTAGATAYLRIYILLTVYVFFNGIWFTFLWYPSMIFFYHATAAIHSIYDSSPFVITPSAPLNDNYKDNFVDIRTRINGRQDLQV